MSVIVGCYCDTGPGCCWVADDNAKARAAGLAAYAKGWSRNRAPKSLPFTAGMWRRGWAEARAANPRARKETA